jgi:hypothetical protein
VSALNRKFCEKFKNIIKASKAQIAVKTVTHFLKKDIINCLTATFDVWEVRLLLYLQF